MVQRIYFLGFFLREASRNEDCNAVPELESHNLYLFFQAVQIKNQTVGWVLRPLDPEAVFPKENESGDTQEDHVLLLHEFFIVCHENHLRIKFEKCQFMREEM